MNNKLVITILLIFVIVFTVSCKKDNDKPKHMKVGMFVVGDGFNDSGYKQNCKAGLLMALKESEFDTLFVSSLTYTQEEIDFFPENGFDVLFLVGSLASEQLLKSAGKYNQTQFVIIDYTYDGPLQNVKSINYNIDESAFPLGFLAAYWASKKDNSCPVVGLIGGMKIAPIERFITAYGLGIRYFNDKYNTNVEVVNSFLNSFDDWNYGYQVADSLIDNYGVDVMIPVAGAAGNGALYATKANNKWAIGVDADQYYSLPEVSDILLSSCMKMLDTTICSVAISLLNEVEISSATYTGNLKNLGVSMAPFHNYSSQIPDSIKAVIESIKSEIIDGSIDTGF